MGNHRFSTDLEDICYKYERLGAMISIIQMFVSESVDVVGAPENSLSDALFEIETEMDKTNNRLRAFMKGKAVDV